MKWNPPQAHDWAPPHYVVALTLPTSFLLMTQSGLLCALTSPLNGPVKTRTLRLASISKGMNVPYSCIAEAKTDSCFFYLRAVLRN